MEAKTSKDYILDIANICNIYDMAGNLYEWTMEGNSGITHNLRGGFFYANGVQGAIGRRGGFEPKRFRTVFGFRPSLYIKLPT